MSSEKEEIVMEIGKLDKVINFLIFYRNEYNFLKEIEVVKPKSVWKKQDKDGNWN